MQPENSQNTPQGVEHAPMPPVSGGEYVPSLPPLETGLERGQQQFEQAAEAGARASDAAVSVTAAAAIAAPVAPTQNPVADAGQATAGSPMVAADEDLIEKEWVDKAKDIITQTKDDPHARTAQVNALQRDYLQKRYGKIVGATE